MRVACVNQDPGIHPERHKGAAVHLRAMREAFRAGGATVLPFDEKDDDTLAEALDHAGREAPIDLLYERYAVGRLTGSDFAEKRGIPFVLEVNSPLAEEAERWRNGSDSEEARERDAMLFGRARCVIAVSSMVADYARRRGAGDAVVHVFPNGVDASRFRPRNVDDRLRDELIPPGRCALLFHGRLRPWHGFERLARAAARLLERGVEIQLLLVGEGPFEEHVRDLVPTARVSRVGWVPHDEVGAYVACGDVLPITYGAEDPCYFSPLKLAEAMACGVVPVVPLLGDLASVVHHGRNGLTYPAGDQDALVDAIESLVRNPGDRSALALAAIEDARSRSWEAIAAFALRFADERAPR